MADRPVTTRPGGRSSRVLAAVYTAVGELMGQGAERITFPIVAERAGVNPTTLYRRWPDVTALLEEVAVAALTRAGDAVPDTGSLEADLADWAGAIHGDITRPERSRYLRAMVAARSELLDQCPVNDARREQAAELVQRAAARGEAVPTVEQILDHLVAPLYYYVFAALPIDEERPKRLVHDVLSMAR